MARYAVEPDMNAEQLLAHLAEIRGWWEERAAGPDSRAQVCRLLMQADERLVATVGGMMNDPAWWREQAGLSPQPVRPPDPVGDTAPPGGTPAAPDAPADQPSDWRSVGRAKFWSAVALLERAERPAPVRTTSAAQPAVPIVVETPAPVLLIDVHPIRADGDRCLVEVSWAASAAGNVHVRWSTAPPDFAAGDVVPPGVVDAWGTGLTGTPQIRGNRLVLSAMVPTGYLVYLPFHVRDGAAVAGRRVAINVAGPVHHLRAERRGDQAVLSWTWPAGSTTAIVEWTTPGATQRREITLAEYTADHGCVVPGSREGATATVQALGRVGDSVALSPAATVNLPPTPVMLRYSLERNRRFGRRAELVVGVVADRDCADVTIDVVVGAQRIMPGAAADGRRIAALGPITLTSGVEQRFHLDWPERPGRGQYWIRCFFRTPSPFSPIDPPVSRMRFA